MTIKRSAFGESGQSLVGALVGLGVAGVTVAVLASIMQIQNRETQALSDKLASLDLERTMIAALSDGTVCKYVLNNPTVLTFNANNVSAATPQVIGIPGPLYASVNPSPGPALAEVNKPASRYSNNLIISSISLSIYAGSGSSYLANWIVQFDGTRLVRSIRPVSVSTTLTVDASVPSAAKIVNCQGGAAPPPSGPPPGTLCGSQFFSCAPGTPAIAGSTCQGATPTGVCHGGVGDEYIGAASGCPAGYTAILVSPIVWNSSLYPKTATITCSKN